MPLKPKQLKYIYIILIIFSHTAYGQLHEYPIVQNVTDLDGKNKKSKNAEMWERNVQYLGEFKDTINLIRISDLRAPIGDNKILITDSLSNAYPFYGNGQLKIIVDTSQIVTLQEFEWWTKKRKYQLYNAYPIFISNNSDSTTIIGYAYNIPIILEALDSDNIWKAIEVPYLYDCGLGLEYILLKTEHLLCVLAPVYTGSFNTKLRYKLGDNYSNVFMGKIDKRQFSINERTIRK